MPQYYSDDINVLEAALRRGMEQPITRPHTAKIIPINAASYEAELKVIDRRLASRADQNKC